MDTSAANDAPLGLPPTMASRTLDDLEEDLAQSNGPVKLDRAQSNIGSRTLDDLEDEALTPSPHHVASSFSASATTVAPSQTSHSNLTALSHTSQSNTSAPSFVPRTFPFSPAVPAVLKVRIKRSQSLRIDCHVF